MKASFDSEKWQSLFDALPEAVAVVDPSFRISWINRSMSAFLGRPAEEVIGGNCHETLHDAEIAEEVCPACPLLKERSREGRLEIELPARQTWIRIATASFHDAAGALAGVVHIVHDISESKRVQEALRRSEEQVRQAQKMEAVGRLAGGIAHDFNNLMTAIRGYSDLLLHRLGRDSPHRREVEEIRKAGDRATSLTQQLLAFGRKQMLQPVVLDLSTVVAGLDTMLRRLIGEDIDLITVLEPEPWKVKVDPGQVEQVILNLVINARDAMPRGGKLVIETANVSPRELSTRRPPGAPPGPYVALTVADEGSGMDEETLSRLFEPFFTTKEQGRGTGLGLSTVYGIVKQSGGDIVVESELGKGSVFKVLFPRFEEETDEAGAGKPPGAPRRGHESLLLVEDDGMVRRFALDVLRAHGYTVLSAADGIEAIEIAKSFEGEIHLVITDVVMPRMGGKALVESLGGHLPGARVLYISGYTDETILRHGATRHETALLHKPFTIDALLRKVREVLDR